MGHQMATSEIRKYFQARFVKISIIFRALRRGKLLALTKRKCNYFFNFMSIPFDHLSISRVTNYAYNPRFLTSSNSRNSAPKDVIVIL